MIKNGYDSPKIQVFLGKIQTTIHQNCLQALRGTIDLEVECTVTQCVQPNDQTMVKHGPTW